MKTFEDEASRGRKTEEKKKKKKKIDRGGKEQEKAKYKRDGENWDKTTWIEIPSYTMKKHNFLNQTIKKKRIKGLSHRLGSYTQDYPAPYHASLSRVILFAVKKGFGKGLSLSHPHLEQLTPPACKRLLQKEVILSVEEREAWWQHLLAVWGCNNHLSHFLILSPTMKNQPTQGP